MGVVLVVTLCFNIKTNLTHLVQFENSFFLKCKFFPFGPMAMVPYFDSFWPIMTNGDLKGNCFSSFPVSLLFCCCFFQGIGPLSVYLCVYVSVCSLFEVPFKCLLAPTSQSSWGKVVERIGLIFEHFCSKMI